MTARGATALIEEITEQVRQGLEEQASELAERGRSLEEIGPADELARRMLAAVPAPSPWDDLVGPFYGTGQVTKLLGGISRQALDDRRKRRTLLGLKTTDGVLVYPLFQFDSGNRILPGLSEVLQCFAGSDVDDWAVAGWLISPLRSLENRSVVDWLRHRGELQPVLALARDMARRFSH